MVHKQHFKPEHKSRASKLRIPVWSLFVGTSVAVIFAVIWHSYSQQERNYIKQFSYSTVSSLDRLIQQDIHNRIAVIHRLANRWHDHKGSQDQRWYDDIQNIIISVPGYQSIGWADNTLHVQWAGSVEGKTSPPWFDIQSNAAMETIVKNARDTKQIMLTSPLNKDDGTQIFLIIVPTYNSDGFVGFMFGVVDSEKWLRALLPEHIPNEVDLHIMMDNVSVCAPNDTIMLDHMWTTSVVSQLANLDLKIEVTPKPEYVAFVHSRFFNTLFIAGASFTILAVVGVYLSMLLVSRARYIKATAIHLEALFKSLPGASYRYRAYYPWSTRFISEGCLALTGYSRDAFEKHQVHWGELTHPDDRERVQAAVTNAIHGDGLYEFEYRLIRRDGSHRWMWERGVVVGDPDDPFVSAEGFITDITKQKQYEIGLIEARGYSRAIVEAANEAIITISADSVILTFNREAERLFAYTSEEAIGKTLDILLPKMHLQEYQVFIKHFSATGELKPIFTSRELTMLSQDGTVLQVQMSINKIKHQKVKQLVCLIRDISAERSAQRESARQREHLAHIDRLNVLGEMASSIAHEINQPLTSISLFSISGKTLLSRGQIERMPEIFDKLSKHAKRAGAIIQRMQNMARSYKNVKELANCNDLVNEIVEFAEADARSRQIRINRQLAETLPALMVEKIQIQQVILNLVRNGMEAIESAKDCLDMSITITTLLNAANEVEIAVIDNGTGVSELAKNTIFEAFSSTKTSSMGVGLSISKAIIEAHGGHLGFFNNDTVGATFYFSIPVANPLPSTT